MRMQNEVQNLKRRSRALDFDVGIGLTTRRSDLTYHATFYLGEPLKEESGTIRSEDWIVFRKHPRLRECRLLEGP